MSLLKDLENIQQKKSVDWPAIRNRLSRSGIDRKLINQAVTAKFYSEKTYIVKIIDTIAFDKIVQYCQPVDKSSRASASKTGNSHLARVNGALLVATTHQSVNPYVHVFKNACPIPIPPKQHAVIIENLECFLYYQNTYQFMNQLCAISHDIDDIEFIFAAGNSISNKKITPYLIQFTGEIFCLLDIDIGGLRTYKALLDNGLSITNTHFVIPNDIDKRLQSSRKKASETELHKLNKYLGISDQIDGLIRLIHQYQTTIEQESYRA